jgi:hypothetical protein
MAKKISPFYKTTHINPELHLALRREALDQGIPLTVLVEKALTSYLKKRQGAKSTVQVDG